MLLKNKNPIPIPNTIGNRKVKFFLKFLNISKILLTNFS